MFQQAKTRNLPLASCQERTPFQGVPCRVDYTLQGQSLAFSFYCQLLNASDSSVETELQ